MILVVKLSLKFYFKNKVIFLLFFLKLRYTINSVIEWGDIVILRKPYAFLIKYFKLIHIIMTVITFYLIYKSTGILSFLNDYITNNTSVVGTAITSRLYHPLMFFSVILIIVMSIVVLIVMKLKEKPVMFYIFNTAVYIFILLIFIFSNNTLGTMEIEIVDIRIVKLFKDMFTAMIILEFISMCLTFVRATGFDVKKFDFVKDLQQLNIEEADNEEFEVDVEVDTDRFMRNLRRKLRHARYVYIENKLIINVALLVVLVFIVFGLYILNKDQDKIYRQNKYFTVSNFTMNVTNSYKTKYDYTGKKISDHYTLVLVELHVKNNIDGSSKLAPARMELNVDGISFYPTTKYADSFFDLGTNYENYDITTEEDVYTIIYEVPNHLTNKKMFYRYVNSMGGKSAKVTLSTIDLDKKTTVDAKVGKELVFDEGLLRGSSMKLSSMELNDLFKVEYRFCVEDKECYDSIDNIRPTLDQNYDETLMRLTLDVNFNENYTNDLISSSNDIVSTFMVIKYRLEGDKKDRTLRPTVRKISNDSDKKHVYLEVNSELKQATNIVLEFQIRNKIVSYKIK